VPKVQQRLHTALRGQVQEPVWHTHEQRHTLGFKHTGRSADCV